MAGEVNRVPLGLLGLLDMKARGQTPRILDPSVQLGIEAADFYLQANRTTIQAAGSFVSGVGYFPSFTVPNGIAYYIHGCSIGPIGNLAAGTTYRGRLAYRQNAQVAFTVAASDSWTYTAGERPNISGDLPRLLMPGASVGFYAESVTLGTSVQMTAWCDLTPLEV